MLAPLLSDEQAARLLFMAFSSATSTSCSGTTPPPSASGASSDYQQTHAALALGPRGRPSRPSWPSRPALAAAHGALVSQSLPPLMPSHPPAPSLSDPTVDAEQDTLCWLFDTSSDPTTARDAPEWLDATEPAWLLEAHDFVFASAPNAAKGGAPTPPQSGSTGATGTITVGGSHTAPIFGLHADSPDASPPVVEATDAPV